MKQRAIEAQRAFPKVGQFISDWEAIGPSFTSTLPND